MSPPRRLLSIEQGLVVTVLIAVATLACLMPVHNDTWWHLRNGQEMFRTHTLLFDDPFSFTAHGEFFWNHSWLSQLIFYPLFRIGGPVLLTAFCAIVVCTGWGMTWRLMRGDTVTNVVLFTIALSTATTIWSLRPQVFSIALLPLLAMLAMADRWRLIVPLVALWANLHAGVAMGIAVLAGSVLAALVTDRDRLVQRLVGTVVAVAATLLNPVGFTAWLEMGRSMARSRANQIEEWMLPSAGEHLIFWMVGAAFVWQLATGWRRLRSPGDRVLAMAALVALPVAGGAVRSVPAFMMLMAPALSRLLSQPDDSQKRRLADGGGSVVVTTVVGAAIVAAVVIVATAWTHRWSRLGWDPVSPSAAQAISSCPAPLYNPYEAGGSIIWFAPTQRVFIDSRQDQYATSLVQEGTRVEATGDYHRLFDRYHFNCAAVRPASPIARALRHDGWIVAFTDRNWAVLQRSR